MSHATLAHLIEGFLRARGRPCVVADAQDSCCVEDGDGMCAVIAWDAPNEVVHVLGRPVEDWPGDDGESGEGGEDGAPPRRRLAVLALPAVAGERRMLCLSPFTNQMTLSATASLATLDATGFAALLEGFFEDMRLWRLVWAAGRLQAPRPGHNAQPC